MQTFTPSSRRALTLPTLVLATVMCWTLWPVIVLSAKSPSIVWQKHDQFVRIESQDLASVPQNSHPMQIRPDRIVKFLDALQVYVPAKMDRSSAVPVFATEELTILRDALSNGLAQAGPRDDVTFATIGTHNVSEGGYLRKRLVNTGRVFYRDGKLNVIFGEVQGEYRKKNIYGQRDQDFSPRRFGTRTATAEQDWALVLDSGVEFYNQNGSARPDWVRIDVQAIEAARTAELSQREPAAGPAAIQEVSKQPLPAHEGNSAEQPTQVDETTPPSNTEERLRILKDLSEKGLISDDVYRSKVDEILEQL